MTPKQSEFIKETFCDFLDQNFTPWNINHFSPEHTVAIYTKLQESVPMDVLLNASTQLNKHLESFFHHLGTLEVKIDPFKHISVTTNIDKKTMKSFQLLKHYQPHFEHKEDSNLLIIHEKITKTIFDQLECEQDDFRHHIRMTLPLIEDIGENYAILFGKSRITVRKHLNTSSSEKRFSGLPAEDLEALSIKYFKDLKVELPLLMKKPLQDRFLFQQMSNQEFESNHIKILQQEILKLIKIRSRQDKEVMSALTNYILRQTFDILHSMIAEQLLTQVIEKNPKAEQFLSFYTQGIISIGGQKYQIPPLEDTQGKVWSVANIINVAGQYQGFKQSFEKKSSHVNSMDNTLENIDDEIINAGNTIKKIKAGAIQNNQELSHTAAEIQKIRHTFQSQGEQLDAEHKAKLVHTVSALEDKEREQMVVRSQFEKGLSKAEKDFSDLKYKKTTTTERYNSEIDNLDELENKHKEIIQKYELMLGSVVKALTGKKVKV